MTDNADHQPEPAVMSLGEHLEELRKRLIRGLLGVGLISFGTLWYGKDIVRWLCQPLFEAQRQLGLPRQTVNLSVATGFMVYMKVGCIAGLALGAPWVVYQIWKFIKPGLYAREQRLMALIGPMSAAMSLLGVLFTYYLMLPAALSFLLMFSVNYPPVENDQESPPTLRTVTTFFNRINALIIPSSVPPAPPPAAANPAPATQPAENFQVPVLDHDPAQPKEGQVWFNERLSELRLRAGGLTRVVQSSAPTFMVPQIDINQYLDLVTLLGLVIVVSFQLPVLMTILGAVGLVDPRWLAKYRRYVLFGCFLVGIFGTPNQDVVSNLLFPLFLWGLFEFGLVMMRLVRRENPATSD